MMIAASQQRCSRRRAECRGVEPNVAQASFSDPFHCRCRYNASKRARSAKADVICHDEQNIRCIFRRYRDRWPAGFGLRRIGIDFATEGRGAGWKMTGVRHSRGARRAGIRCWLLRERGTGEYAGQRQTQKRDARAEVLRKSSPSSALLSLKRHANEVAYRILEGGEHLVVVGCSLCRK